MNKCSSITNCWPLIANQLLLSLEICTQLSVKIVFTTYFFILCWISIISIVAIYIISNLLLPILINGELLTSNTIELYPTIFKNFNRNRWRLVFNLIILNISGQWLKIKKLLKKYGSKVAVNLQWTSLGCAIETIPFNGIFAIECVVSIAPLAVDLCKFTAVLPYFFNNFFIFSQWPLILI